MIDSSNGLCLLLLEINLAPPTHCTQTNQLPLKRRLDWCLPTFGTNSPLLLKASQQIPTSSCSPLTALHPWKTTGLSQVETGRRGRSPNHCAHCRCSTEQPLPWRDLHGYIPAPPHMAAANQPSIARSGKMSERHFERTTESYFYPFQYNTTSTAQNSPESHQAEETHP